MQQNKNTIIPLKFSITIFHFLSLKHQMFFFFFNIQKHNSLKNKNYTLYHLQPLTENHICRCRQSCSTQKSSNIYSSLTTTSRNTEVEVFAIEWWWTDCYHHPPYLYFKIHQKKKKKVIRYGEDILKSHFWFFCYCVVSLLCQSSSTSFICSFIYLFIYFSIRQMTS